jgi:hypothetical protein
VRQADDSPLTKPGKSNEAEPERLTQVRPGTYGSPSSGTPIRTAAPIPVPLGHAKRTRSPKVAPLSVPPRTKRVDDSPVEPSLPVRELALELTRDPAFSLLPPLEIHGARANEAAEVLLATSRPASGDRART